MRARIDAARESRFRLRRWGAGGTPDGSVSFVVSRPTSGAAAPSEPARGEDMAARLAALEADAAASRARVARLGARVAAAERLIARVERVVVPRRRLHGGRALQAAVGESARWRADPQGYGDGHPPG